MLYVPTMTLFVEFPVSWIRYMLRLLLSVHARNRNTWLSSPVLKIISPGFKSCRFTAFPREINPLVLSYCRCCPSAVQYTQLTQPEQSSPLKFLHFYLVKPWSRNDYHPNRMLMVFHPSNMGYSQQILRLLPQLFFSFPKCLMEAGTDNA